MYKKIKNFICNLINFIPKVVLLHLFTVFPAAGRRIIFHADITHCKWIFNIAQTSTLLFVKDNSNFVSAALFA